MEAQQNQPGYDQGKGHQFFDVQCCVQSRATCHAMHASVPRYARYSSSVPRLHVTSGSVPRYARHLGSVPC